MFTVTIIFALITGFLFTKLGSDFIPQLNEGDLILGLVRGTDISIDESVRQQSLAEKIIYGHCSSFSPSTHAVCRRDTQV